MSPCRFPARFAWALAVALLAIAALTGCNFGDSSTPPGNDASTDSNAAQFDVAVPEASDSSPHDAGPDTSGGFHVGGHVSGLAGSGLVLANNGGDDLAVSGDGAFTFKTPVAAGKPYAVTVATQPSKPSQTCTVAGGTGTVGSADVTDVKVTCTTSSYAIGGTVVGLDATSKGGLVLADDLGGGVTDTVTVDQNGAFTFPKQVPSGGSFAVSVKTNPTSPAQSCSVSGGSGQVVAGAITSIVVNCASNAYVLSGTVSGLQGKGLALQNGSDVVAVSANGTFAFPTAIASGASYAVTVAKQPSAPTQVCTVTGGSGTMGSANVTSVSVACVTSTFPVGGTVNGLTGSGLVLQINGGETVAVSAAGSFAFATAIASGAPYAVTVKTQPTSPSQTCSVSGGSGVVDSGPVTSVLVTCSSSTFPVQVTASGVAGSGLTLTLNGADPMKIPANGQYAFDVPIASGSPYLVAVSVEPSSPTQSCYVGNASGTVGNGAVTDVTVFCTTSSFPVTGTISGLTGTGLVLTDNGGDSLTITPGATTFAFTKPVLSGAKFDVEIGTQPTGPSQTCQVSGNQGVVGGAAVSSVVVNCGTNSYTVGGTVTHLAGTGLVLQNGTATVAVSSNGSYSFPAIPSGSSYDVTVKTQPTVPTQICTVSNPKGTVGGANVTTVGVDCVTQSFTVGGQVTGLAPNTSVVLEDNLADDLTVSAAGGFTFKTPVASNAPYSVTVKTQPTSPWQTCAPVGTSGAGTVGGAPVTTVQIACTPNLYQVNASVSGLAGSGMALSLNGGAAIPIAKDGTYALGAKLASGTQYTVTVATPPTSPTQVCTVSQPSTVIGGTDVTVNVSCTTSSFFVGGSVSGLNGTLVLVDTANGNATVQVPSAALSFKFPNKVLSGNPYNVSVQSQPPNQSCKVTGGQGTVGAGDVTTIAVNCTDLYTVGGSVVTNPPGGAIGAPGVSISDGTQTIKMSSTGTFAFSALHATGYQYTVSVTGQPTSPVQNCVATSNTGTVANSNVNNVLITCTTQAFTVGGQLSGLGPNAPSAVLQDNKGDDLTVTTNGSFTFKTPVLSGATYSVTVKTPPPGEVCSVSGGTGTVGSAAVTSVVVSCAPPPLIWWQNSKTPNASWGPTGDPNSTFSKSFTLINNGGTTTGLLAVSDALAADMKETNTCSNTQLAPGKTCTVTVTWSPTTAGIESGRITVSDPAETNTPIALLVTGAVGLVFGPTPIDYGTVAFGATSASQSITLFNYGTITYGGQTSQTMLNWQIDPASQGDQDWFTENNPCWFTVMTPNTACTLTQACKPIVNDGTFANIGTYVAFGGNRVSNSYWLKCTGQ